MNSGTPVYTTKEGDIAYAIYGWNDGFGNLMKVQHGDGNRSWYAHLQSFVKTAGHVNWQEQIALSDSTGNSTGPHLHFEVRNSGNASIWIRDMSGIRWYSGNPNSPCQASGHPDGEADGPSIDARPTNTPVTTTCNYNGDQIVLYSGTNFGGACVVLGIGEYPHPSALGAVGNDNTRSIRVGGNVKARLFADDNYSGWEEGRDGDDSDLTNDTIQHLTSSARVERRAPSEPEHPIQLYDPWHYEGDSYNYADQPGNWNMGSIDNRVSSLRLKSGWSVRLFEMPDISGTSICLTSSDDDFGDDTFEDGSSLNDRASSCTLYQQEDCPNIVPTSTYTPEPTNTYTPSPTITHTPLPSITPTPIAFVPCPRSDGYYNCDQSQPVNYTPVNDLIPASDFLTDGQPDLDDGRAVLNLPFAYSFYNSPVLTVAVSINGNLQFDTNYHWFSNRPLPTQQFDKVIAPYWDDLDLRQSGNIYTRVLGSAPNRVFVIEWRAVPVYADSGSALNFAVKLYEGQERLSIEYIDMSGDQGSSATSGIQERSDSNYLLYSFNQNVLSSER